MAAETLIERLESVAADDRVKVLGAIERSATADILRISRSFAEQPGMERGEKRIRLAAMVECCRDLCDVVDAHLHFSTGSD